MERITYSDMEDYINTIDEALEILADVANGDYKLENFRLDLQDFVQEREKERGQANRGARKNPFGRQSAVTVMRFHLQLAAPHRRARRA